MFFLMSLFTYYMTTEEYGIISSALMIIQFLSIVFSLSTTSSISRYYFKFVDDKEELRGFLGTSFVFLFLSGIVFLLVFLIFGKFFFQQIFPELPYNPYLIWIFLICVMQPFNMAYLALLKAQQKLKKYTLLYSVYYMSQFALMLITIVYRDMKQDGYIISLLLSNVIFIFITGYLLRKEAKFSLDKKFVKLSLKYSLAFIPAELFTTINALIDRFYILGFLSLSALGVYQIGIQIGAILVLITRALNYAYLPHFMTIYESKTQDYTEIYKFANFFVFVTVIITGYISILSPYFIEYFLDKNYADAKNVVVYINFMYAFNSVYFINVNILSLTPQLVRSKTLFLILGGVINLFLNYFLIGEYGLIGAAIATFIGFLITNLLLVYSVKRNTDFIFKSLKNIVFIIASFAAVLLILKIATGNLFFDIVLILALFTCISTVLFMTMHKLNPIELIKIKLK